jgi:AcrR family transcriptional regulator
VAEGKRTRANGRASRQAILDVAYDVFAERGLRGTTLREVAVRVGMSQPGLMHHFPTKDDLLLEVMRTRQEISMEDIKDPLTRELPDLREAIEALGRIKQRDPVEQLLLTTLSAEAIPEDHPLHQHFVDMYVYLRKTLAKVIRRAQAEGSVRPDVDAAVIAKQVIATLDGLRLQWLIDPKRIGLDASMKEYAQRVADDLAPRSPKV